MADPPVQYAIDEEVNLVGGIYRNYKRGIYKGPAGKTMCNVLIGTGRNAKVRTIRLTSIGKRIQPNATSTSTTGRSATVTIDRDELEGLLSEMENLKICTSQLEAKLKRLSR